MDPGREGRGGAWGGRASRDGGEAAGCSGGGASGISGWAMPAARGEYTAPWWVVWLHRVPHLSLRLQWVNSTFNPRDEDYQEVSLRRPGPGPPPQPATPARLPDRPPPPRPRPSALSPPPPGTLSPRRARREPRGPGTRGPGSSVGGGEGSGVRRGRAARGGAGPLCPNPGNSSVPERLPDFPSGASGKGSLPGAGRPGEVRAETNWRLPSRAPQHPLPALPAPPPPGPPAALGSGERPRRRVDVWGKYGGPGGPRLTSVSPLNKQPSVPWAWGSWPATSLLLALMPLLCCAGPWSCGL